VIENVEGEGSLPTSWEKRSPAIEDEFDAVAFEALKTARRVKAKALVCITKGGNTALRLGSYHPDIPIIGVTFNEDVGRRITLIRGVRGLVLKVNPKIEDVLLEVNNLLKTEERMEIGDPIVFLTVTLSSVGTSASNLFTVQRIQ
jgi:pyruvate kinase